MARLLVVVALLSLACALARASELDDEVVLEGRVSEERERPALVEDARALDGDPALAGATPEDALESLSGVQLAREGGPLAPVRVRVRGVGGARLTSELMGLRLDDPLTGELDAAALPWLALSSARAGGGRLELALPTVARATTVHARAGAGTLDTLRLDGSVVVRGLGADRVQAAASLGSTSGAFSYLPSSSTGSLSGGAPAVRLNNDQQRALALVHASTWMQLGRLEALAFGSVHEGGVPGFATSPTDGLRARHVVGGARGALALERGLLSGELEAGLRASSRSTWDALRPRPDEIAAASTWVAMLARTDGLLQGLALEARARGEQSAVVAAPIARSSFDVEGGGEWRLFDRWLLGSATVGASVFSDLGPLPRGAIGIELSPSSSWALGARLAHDGRAPTLDELYAPRGIVLGNPALDFERNTDLEAYAALSSDSVVVRVAAFAGRMDDAILYVSRNAFEVEPVNTGPLWRAGLEGRVAIAPVPFLGVDVSASALASRLDVTGAPLPVVPPLQSRTALRLGPLDGPTLHAVLRQRAPVTNTVHGTLPTAGYALVDVVSRLPVGRSLALLASLTNALDVLDARDANLLPLPGRQLFVSLEVRS